MALLPPLRSKLFLLAAVGVVPMLVLSLVLGYFLLRHEQETFREAASARNRTFLKSVDSQMLGYLGTLRALAASASLENGDLRSFHEEARRVLASQPQWRNILLLDLSGLQLMNLRYPYGAPLPGESQSDNPHFKQVLTDEQPAIGSLNPGPLGSLPGIAVRMPVLNAGSLRYVLEFILEPVALGKLIDAGAYPGSWVVALMDRNGRFIARRPLSRNGDQATPHFLAAVQHVPEGWYVGKTLEGRDVYTAFKRSDLTGWIIGAGIPRAEIDAVAYRATAYMALGTLLSLAVAFAFAYWLSSYVTAPITLLAAAARRIGHDPQPVELVAVKNDPHVREVLEVASALQEAAASLQERESLREGEQRALLAADKAKDEFLAMLGHELRNPLSSIVASAHVLRLSKPGAAAAVQAHDVIERQAQQMARLVEDLLDVSRLAMGKVQLHCERLDLAVLAERVLKTWQQTRRSRAARTQTDLASAWVQADRTRMEQILLNLLDNAEKFSAPGDRIYIRVSGADGKAVLEVRDEGQGIAEEDIPHIFKMFVQAPQSLDRPQGGLGLGLTLVQRLAQLHGGEVSVYSAGRGSGAVFTVRLPLARAPAHLAAFELPAVKAAGRRVLLVEDDDDGRRMMEAMLALEGHTVRTAATGAEAVQMAQDWHPDIALVDIGLPDIDGHEVARRIRALPLVNSPKLVAISGFGQPGDLHNAYEAGFDLHLTKPVAPQFLRDVMHALTARGSVSS